MKKAFLLAGIFIVFLSATSFGLFAQQADLMQMSRDFTAKSEADRAKAYRLAGENGWSIMGTGKDGSYFELQKMLYGMPAYYITMNANAAKSTRADSVNMVIGGGTGFVLREWDAGAPRVTHQEYAGRVTWADPNPYSIHFHSTHVAGTLIASGVQAAAKGMSYSATLRAFEWNNDYGEMSSEASAGMNLSNHSYGFTRGWYYNTGNSYWYWYGDSAISQTKDYLFGFYDDEAQAVDQIANAAPNYLIVVSASNDRGEGPAAGTKHYFLYNYSQWRFSTKTREKDGGTAGYDCIPDGMQLAKNSLTVGAVTDVLNYTGPGSVVMTTFSSWGPADDGRIKPDIVGNGYQLYSSAYTSDAAYATYSGTSMASPNVCGSLGLLQDYYRDTHGGTPMRAATLKGLAINTALEAGPNPGPDYMFGWGLLNTYAGYKLLNKDYLNDAKGYIEQLTLNQGQTLEYWYRVSPSTPELRVTICWNDPVGTPPSHSVDPRTRMLVNDLDLRAVKGATTYYPWKLDPNNPSNAATQADNIIDNVEQVGITSPAAGVYAIRITHKGTLSGGSQNFSLIVSGAERNHVWHVYANGSGDAPTIASAVSYAVDGDSIYAHGGVFNEHDISVSKQLVIKGIADAGSPIVDAQTLGRCFNFPSSSKVITLDALTLRNGAAPNIGFAYHGGGILCQNSSVTISNCAVRNNSAASGGGGISADHANPVIRNCTFFNNSSGGGGGGGAVEAYFANAAFDSCVIYDNTSTLNGGGVWLSNSSPSFLHTTVTHNSGTLGGGIYVGPSSNPTLTNTIVSFSGGGGGIYGDPLATGAALTCCDVYGNTGGNYGGTITDKTGINNNISKDPIFCSVATDNYTISSLSSCAPGHSPCGQLIGALPVACANGPDLIVANVQFSGTQPAFGDSVRATVKVKNIGQADATKSFYVDYYQDLASPPAAGAPGDQRFLAAGLAAGDSVTWVTAWAKETIFEEWTSYFRVDTGDSILETNESNNLSGPLAIMWQIPKEIGWPVATGFGFHSSPAIASIDADESNLEIAVGCDDGKLYVLKNDGTNASGWPVTIGDTLFSSPAVADITGDYHREIVIGGKDGKIYAYDYPGTKLWEYATGNPIHRTPVLVDLDKDGKCEVLCSSGNALYALEGDGTAFAGSWPYAVGAGTLTSPAAGDVDGDGTLEIAAIAYGFTAPVESRVYLLEPNGTLSSGSWPAVVDTVIVADPVLGNVISPGTDLEIIAGAVNGKVYVWDMNGTVWPTPPRVTGAIKASPMLTQIDPDAELEIVVSSGHFVASPPPGHWESTVTAIDNTGSIITGWPNTAGTWANEVGPVPSPISIGVNSEAMIGSASRSYYSWDRLGALVYGFPVSLGGDILTSAAADDIDRDGKIELVVASGSPAGSIHCYELYQPNYATSNLWWPMFRHDRARTGCYGSLVPTAVEEPKHPTPAVTRIRSIYPNPFNPLTRIAFDLSNQARVELSVYDVAGRKVATLVDRELDAGKHEVIWNGRTGEGAVVSSGIYFCRLTVGNLVETKKMVLLR